LLASINTEKFCPSVLQCYPRAFGPRATLHNFGAKFFSVDLGTTAPVNICIMSNK